VVLDIEDSMPLEERPRARGLLAEEITELHAAAVGAVVRINPFGPETEVEVAAATVAGLTALMLPKASTPAEVQALHDLLSYHEGRAGLPRGGVGILPLPETAQGLHDAHLLAKASPRVKGIVGVISGPVTADVARAFGFRASLAGTEQLYMNSKLVLDSRAAGAPFPIAGVFGVPVTDLAATEGLIRRARDLGYSGVCVMHPSHVALASAVFRPTSEEVAYFTGLLAAFEAAERRGLGAVTYQGAMVDYAMLPLAREVVEEARRLGMLGG
jgi:citrate lyase subunit beta / citryl-CoA lyase